MSKCSLPCTSHQIYAWLTHRSKRGGPPTTARKSDGKKMGMIDRDRMDGVEETQKDKKMISPGKDETEMDGDRPIDLDRLAKDREPESREARKKGDAKKGEQQRQELILIFSQQVAA